jgi:hypothetical protein
MIRLKHHIYWVTFFDGEVTRKAKVKAISEREAAHIVEHQGLLNQVINITKLKD